MAVCNKDCFNCPFDDCINDAMDAEDRRQSLLRDLLTLPKEKAAVRLRNRAYVAENRAAVRQSCRDYWARHRDEINARRRARYGAPRQQEAIAYQRQYYREHRDEILKRAAERYAARKEIVHNEEEA